MPYSPAEKVAEIKRELMWRRKVYPALIAKEKLTRQAADRYCAILMEIKEDYQMQADQMILPLEA